MNQNERQPTGKAQIVKCSHGIIFAACTEPECYEDADWQRDVRRYIKGGCTVDVVTSAEVKELFSQKPCKCDKLNKQPEVIKPIFIENQLTLEF
jgi:hypothetical protein